MLLLGLLLSVMLGTSELGVLPKRGASMTKYTCMHEMSVSVCLTPMVSSHASP
jgi:hypothetical protein